MTTFIAFRLLEAQVIYEISKVLFLVVSPHIFLVIFSAGLSGSDDFVLFDLLDGNGALITNVLRCFSFVHKINWHLWTETLLQNIYV